MKIARTAIDRPVTVVMVFIGLALIGIFAAFRLPIEQFPEIETPYVGIGIPYPNSTAQEVEQNVARPVEEVLSTMSGIDKMYTFSHPGYLFVNLLLDFNRDVTGKGIEGKQLIESIRGRLPSDIRYIQLRQRDPNSAPLMNLMIVAKDLDPNQAYNILDTEVRSELERLPGVNSVDLFGVDKYYVRIAIDPDRMEAYGLDYLDIQRRLMAENFFVSGGEVRTPRKELQVRPLGQYQSLDDIRRLPINNKGLVLDDVAEISLVPEKDSERRRVNGERAIGVSIYKRPEANLVAVTREVDAAIDKIKKENVFSDARFVPMGSQADTVVQSLNDLRNSGLMGALLSVLTLFVFLRRLTPSLLIAGTVPLALCATLGVMYFLGMSLNILSVVGLMLAVGLLVDNSVVVSEAITLRRGDTGTDPKTAADKGVSEVGLAITAGTLTTVIVFVPAFMAKMQQVAIIQQNIAIPLCTALLGSLLVAQTLVPTLMARMPIEKTRLSHPVIDRLSAWYGSAVRFTLNHRLISFIVAALIAASGAYVYRMLDINMNPESESPRLQLNYFMRGSMDIDVIEGFVKKVDDYLLANKERFEINNVFSSYDTDRGRTTIDLVKDGKLSPRVVEEMIMKNIPEVAGVRLRFSSFHRGFGGGRGGPPGSGALGVKLTGDSTEELLRLSDELESVLEKIPMLTNVQTDAESSRQELQIRMKPELASQMGVSASAVAQAVSVAIGGRQMRRSFIHDGDETDVFVELENRDQANLDTLKRLPIFLPDGSTVPLETLANISFAQALRSIRRENRETAINVNFSMRRGPPIVGKIMVEGIMKKFQLPPGYRWELGSEFSRDNETFRDMLENFGLAILLVYMLMAALFESVLFPTTVLIAIGYSIVGVFWTLWLSGTTLTAMALTGMLLLAGIVVNNGIVLLDRIIQLRRAGIDRTTAIIESGRHRLRPILLTVGTTIAGMLPLAVGDVRVGGIGPSYFPMARAIIGGLTFSTIITLLILPLVYVLFDDMKSGLVAFWNETKRRAASARDADGAGTTSAEGGGG